MEKLSCPPKAPSLLQIRISFHLMPHADTLEPFALKLAESFNTIARITLEQVPRKGKHKFVSTESSKCETTSPSVRTVHLSAGSYSTPWGPLGLPAFSKLWKADTWFTNHQSSTLESLLKEHPSRVSERMSSLLLLMEG